ncbi:MAG TPA: fatty acid desaturase, partial [Saprospiraceae bacterium]|nr:fatty acid desaturase [Saprospiraceae bacterium]
NPLEIRAIHHEHHRAYNRLDNDERAFGPADRGKSFGWYVIEIAFDGLRILNPFREMQPSVVALRRRRPGQFREVLVMRGLFTAWFVVLVLLDWRDTLFFYLPSVVLIGSFGSTVMNLTDHIPGDPSHTFRLATWTEPRTRTESLFSAVNHQTCATHLTHHLFPRIHWVHLRALQAQLAPIYERHRAPYHVVAGF